MRDETYLDCLAVYGAGGAHPGSLALTKKLLSGESIDEKTTILDVGCGTGQTASYIHKTYNAHIAGVDSHPMMVEKAKQRLQDVPVKIIQASLEDLPIETGSYDVVLSESVLAFTKAEHTLKEINRVLHSDGILLAIEMVLEHNLPNEEQEQLKQFYGIPQILTVEEWKALIEKAGFKSYTVDLGLNFKEENEEIDLTPDFMMSNHISEAYEELLETHFHLRNTYERELGYRVFRCTK